MPQLQLLRPDHAPALLAFERENRAYFAASVPDRGDAYFAGFAERHSELLGWAGRRDSFFHVLVEEDATAAVRQVCALAVAEYGWRVLRAAARVENAGSGTVLIRTGFVPTGEVVLSGRPGATYRLELTESEPRTGVG